ncbi:la-related protein 6A isoform X1 [Gossypium australe]|uniref:La-related protein 6A isoform X1 n=1 Tax=Gossypium australe TaxID=47621 RepID=A0A5B6WCQ0_9ROSI|nr:la-related protein 6A isoform X1 [Gossypium australe]
MDSHVEPTIATAGPTALSPPRDSLDLIAVGSVEAEEEIETLSPSSEEDHDHANGQNRDQKQNQENSSATAVLTDDLKNKIIKQARAPIPPHLLSISLIASFRRMKRLSRSYPSIVAALKESSLLVVSSDGKMVKRRNSLPSIEVRDPKLFTVLAENLPEDHSVENIRRIFGEVGNIKNISLRDPHAVEESKKSVRVDILVSSKLHALVEYETVEAAEKAVATLNDERDWRNGMHVKLLKRIMGKHAQRRPAWRGPDPAEKNSNARASDQTGDDENNASNQHHEGFPDDEDGENLSKEKNGHRPRNRGRARKPRTRGTNGLGIRISHSSKLFVFPSFPYDNNLFDNILCYTGHGTTSSSHAIEPSKPPPGPRMPDGTRGFTMGRGRPLVSRQS